MRLAEGLAGKPAASPAMRLVGFVVGLAVALSVATVAGAEEQDLQAGRIFRDCADCPEMVVIPEGSFLMGSSVEDTKRVLEMFSFFEAAGDKRTLLNEQPQHSVTIHHAFGMGKHPTKRANPGADERTNYVGFRVAKAFP